MDTSSDVFPEYFPRRSNISIRGGGTPYDGLYGRLRSKGCLFRLQVYERVRIATVEVNKRVGKSFWKLFGSVKGPKRANK